MSIGPTSSRVSNMMRNELILAALRRSQTAINQTQTQITSGHQISTPSQDPVLAGQIIDASSVLSQLSLYKGNATYGNNLLSATDTALGDITDAVRQAYTVGMNSVGTTTSDSERSTNVSVLNSLIDQVQRLANQQYQGRYLFDGQSGTGDPFTTVNGSVQYNGGTDPFQIPLDQNWTMPVALDGITVFGGQSAPTGSPNALSPGATVNTPLTDLAGTAGTGVQLGTIQVNDGIHPAVTIDLSQAATVGDAISEFNAAAPAGVTLSLNASGTQLVAHGPAGSNLTISDVGVATTARDLGLVVSGGGTTVSGGPLNAKLTTTTLLSSLRGGQGVDAAGISISVNGATKHISMAGMSTVGDLINAVNQSGPGVVMSINSSRQSLSLVNRLSGATMNVGENGGLTGAQLGLRTFGPYVSLDSLNGGAGLTFAGPGQADVQIYQLDNYSFNVSFNGARTVNDIILDINNCPDNTHGLVAVLSPHDGIELIDNSTNNGGVLAAQPLNGSSAADGLGLNQASDGNTLVGWDTSAVQTGGVFAHLAALRTAIQRNDTAGITAQSGLLQDDLTRLTGLRGAVGAQAAQVQSQSDRLDQKNVATQSLLSGMQDVDLSQAVVQFQQLQTQLTASMLTAGKLLNLSLLNFIQ